MAEGLCAAGDLDGVRAHVASGIAIAADAHLPLAVLRLRAILLRALLAANGPRAESTRLSNALARALRRPIPRLLHTSIESAGRAAAPESQASAGGLRLGAGAVEVFLEIAQRSKDDPAAIADVANALCERVGALSVVVLTVDNRVIASAGKPLRDRAAAAAQARSEEHTSELQSQSNLVCRLLLEKKKKRQKTRENE